MINNKLVFNFTDVKTKEELFKKLATEYQKQGLVSEQEPVVSALKAREEQSTTGFENGIAIPHCQTDVKQVIVSVSRFNPINWPSMDQQATELAINIIVPKAAGNEHLRILSKLSGKLMDPEFVNILKTASSSQVVEAINAIEQSTEKVADEQMLNSNELYLAVTACPTGIAHTYMAAENIEKTAKALDFQIKVETRGQSGVDNELTKDEIARAKGIIVAADVKVPLERFTGKKLIQVPVKRGLKNVETLFDQVDQASEYVENNKEEQNEQEEFSLYKSLMNGVTHMLPFVVVGGILTAMRFIFGTPDDIAAGVEPLIHIEAIGIYVGKIGGMLFSMMLPILAAYIAQSIANRPGLMLGFLAGMMASSDGSGFLGAILGAFVAGFIAKGLTNLSKKLPKSLQGSAAILFAPLFGALLIALFMSLFAVPVSFLNNALISGLQTLEDFNPLILGAVVGAMMAIDMGGPINKAAYVTGTLLLAEGNQTFMAAVMAGGMVPPLAIAIATTLNKDLYTKEELEAGKTNYVMGLSFVTEGAIPFAAKRPKKVIPALMFASAIAGALTMLFNITLPAPHGGIFVFPLVNHPLLYLLAIVIGAFIGGICLNYSLKKGEK